MRAGILFSNRISDQASSSVSEHAYGSVHDRVSSLVLVLALLIPLFSLLIPFHPLSARGKLIKGESSSSVYYITGDERFVFPNEQIFKSWYENFDDVETVSDAELADYTLGGNVTYRPGTRLVKLTNNPKVYAVEPGGVLRWVTSETIAKTLYGSGWASRVDDLADGFFTSYEIGNDLEETVYPDGSLLIKDDVYYVVWGGELHEMDETALARNGFQAEFALTVSDIDLPEGSSITREASYLSDTAELGLGEDQENDVVGEERSIDTTIAQGTDDAVIGSFVISLKTKAIMQKVSLMIEAKTNGDDDADEGGLIRGDGDEEQIEANIKNFRVADLAGNVLFENGTLKTSADDDGQTVILSGEKTLLPGRHVFQILADLDEDAPEGEKYQTTFLLSATQWMIKGEESEYASPEKVASDAFTVVEGTIDLARNGEVKSSSIVSGADGPFDVFGFTLSSSLDEDVTIDRIVLTGYVDAGEDDDDFVAGTDTDNQADLTVSDVVSAVYLTRDLDSTTKRTYTIESGGKVVFDGLDWTLSAGEEESFFVQVDVEDDVPTGDGSDRIAFDISSVDEVDIEDAKGDAVEISGEDVNGGENPKSYLTVVTSGAFTISGEGEPTDVVVMKDEDVEFYSFTFSAEDDEDIILDTLYLRFLDQESSRDVAAARIRVDETDYEGSVTIGGVKFTDLNLTIPAGEDVDANVLLDLESSSNGAVSGDSIGLEFESTSFEAIGAVSGRKFDDGDFGDDVTDKTSSGSSAILVRNQPTVTLDSSSLETTTDEDDETPVLQFTMSSRGEGTSKLQTLTFKIETNEEGTDGEENDLFEKWALINGDAQDDNELVMLRDETSDKDDLAEDATGHINFSIYDASSKSLDATPEGFETDNGDYGILVYEFTSPLTLYATTHTYILSLNTEEMAGKSPSIKATLLDGDDFVWNDGSGTDDQNGDTVEDLPITSPTIYIE